MIVERIEELVEALKEYKRVVIIGYPKSGKTTLAKHLIEHTTEHKLIADENYREYSYEEGMYRMLDDCVAHLKENKTNKVILEGCLCYRLLRKGLEKNLFLPDLVIDIKLDRAEMIERYGAEIKSETDINRRIGFAKGLEKILYEFKASISIHKFDKRVIFAQINGGKLGPIKELIHGNRQ